MLRRLFHGGVELEGVAANAAYSAARLAAGAMLAFGHGLGKLPPSEPFTAGVAEMGFPLPVAFAWAASLAEFAGGLGLALGLATRPSALLAGFTMATAAFVKHAQDPFQKKELALLYLLFCLVFLAVGSGRYGLDRRLRR